MLIENLLLVILILSVLLFGYNYFGYPLFIIWQSKRTNDPHTDLDIDKKVTPAVSFIIAAYNEEKVIEQKIKNTLELDYPKDKLQIIIISDGSDDSTPTIVEKYAEIKGMHVPERGGKSAALNRAITEADGDIIVFSDANNDFSVDSIYHLVKHFADESIGAVTGAKHIYTNADRQSSSGDSLYWKYESKIKEAESNLGSITAAEGEILAVRRSLYNPIESFKVNDDAAITFDLIKSGYRVLYEPQAKAYEQASIDLMDDFNVKIRMTFGGFQTMSIEKSYIFPPKTWFAFTFISHKVLRWFAPHFLIAIFCCSLALSNFPLINLFLWTQIAFYLLAFYGWKNRTTNSLPSWIYIPTYFTCMNTALFYGFIRYIKDSSKVEWKKAER